MIERVQLKYLKYILNLKKTTPSFMVHGETGTYPIRLDIQARIISFWTKLLTDNQEQLVKMSSSMYLILYTLYKQDNM